MASNLTFASTSELARPAKFVVVNGRVPREAERCALCGSAIEDSYVRDPRTRLLFCDTRCFAGHASFSKSQARKAS